MLLVGFGLGIVWADRSFVGTHVGTSVGTSVGTHVGTSVGTYVGTYVGTLDEPMSAEAVGWIGSWPITLTLVGGLVLVGLSLTRGGWPIGDRSVVGRGTRCGVMILCASVSFLAGAARLESLLDSAARDSKRTRVEAADSRDAHRIVEARVASRRPTAWGDEVILVGARGVDGRGPIARTLRLSVGDGRGYRTRLDIGSDGESGEHRRARADRLLWPGLVARLALRIRPMESRRNPGTPDRERAWARRGVGVRASLVDPDWVLIIGRPALGAGDRIRQRVEVIRDRWRGTVAKRFSRTGLETGLARALALGDRRGLSSTVRESFRELGLSHLIAISGLHVGLVAGLAGWLVVRLLTFTIPPFALTAMPFGLSVAVAAGAGWLYAWCTGAAVSAQRAALLFALFGLARVFKRNLSPASALAWTALALLAIAPSALFDLGAELSFCACVALLLAGFWHHETGSEEHVDRRAGGEGRFSRSLIEIFSVSVAVSLSTAPLVLAMGMPLSLGSPVFNVLAIPWTAFLVIPTSLLATAGSSWLPPIALHVLLIPAHTMELAVPLLAQWHPRLLPLDGLPLWAVAGIAGMGLFAIRRGVRGLALCAWVALVVVGAAPALQGSGLPVGPGVVFFDMGQGDAALVEGKTCRILIDSGAGPADGTGGGALVRGLRSLGVSRLDVLVVTHGDLDHRAGAARVMQRIRVGELWLPRGGEDDERLGELARKARSLGVVVGWLNAGGTTPSCGDLDVDVLWPPDSKTLLPRPRRRSRNEGSLVLRVSVDGTRILFPADIGREVESMLIENRDLLAADVLKVGHHGSRHSTTAVFLEAVAPAHAVISAPCDPARGLPNGLILDRLALAGVSVWWTGRDGAVSLRRARDRVGFDVVRWGDRRRCRGAEIVP